VQQVQPLKRWFGRAVGLDLHRDFIQVAICEEGLTYNAGRIGLAGGESSAERPGGDGGVGRRVGGR
jgi:hypothetical protein